MSFHSEDCIDARTLVPPDEPVVLVVGAMAHGSVSYCPYTGDKNSTRPLLITSEI